jgi:glycosyltransferase involved in cell wall biosynthesis
LQSYAAVDKVVAVSDKVSRELQEAGVPGNRIVVIHNGVDAGEFHPGQADRRAWQLPADAPLALFAGGIRNALRNLDTVLKALVQVPGVHLAVAGEDRSSPYPAMAVNLGVAERVHFLGYRTDVADLMRAADFFVYPSRYEACSLVLLEAMSSGLPIITATTAGGSELLEPSCSRILEDPNDVDALARHIRNISSDAELRSRMSSAATELAARNSWTSMAEKYVSLFRECCGAKATHPDAHLSR